MGGGASKRALEEVQLRHGESTVQGRREYNEDRCACHHPLGTQLDPLDLGGSLFCVFDGHGGEFSAEYVSTNLHMHLSSNPSYFSGSKLKAQALLEAFVACDAAVLAEERQMPNEMSGTTGVAVLIDHDDILVANCGDTRAILCRAGVAMELTKDHKPTDAAEKARMEAAGARVPDGSSYVEYEDKGLAVARAFGNPLFKSNASKPADEQIIIVHPHQTQIRRSLATDEFMILATDGLWNVCSHQYACDFVRKRLLNNADPEDIAHKLTQHALDKKSNDNVTVVLITFPVAFSGILLAQVPVVGKPATGSSTGSHGSSLSSAPTSQISQSNGPGIGVASTLGMHHK